MKLKQILLYLTFALFNLTSAQDSIFTSGTAKVTFKLKNNVEFYFINCKRKTASALTTTSVSSITGVGKLLLKKDGSGTFQPASSTYKGNWTYYVQNCGFTQYSIYVGPKPVITPTPIPDPEPISSTGNPSYTSTSYNWYRTIGNTSAKQYGPELIRALRTPTGIAWHNGYLYMTTGLVEGNSGIMKVKDQLRTEVLPAVNGDISLNTTHIVSDGTTLYVSGFDSYGAISSAVIAIRNDAEYIFSSGKSFKCQWQDNPYKSGIHVNVAKITGLDVDATTLYVYCGSKCYQYNKTTGALISQVNVSAPNYISKAVNGANSIEMTSTQVTLNGKVICQTPTSPKVTNYNFIPKDFNTYEQKGSVCFGNNSFWVTDAGNCRILNYDLNGTYIGQIAYIPMNYNCSVDKNSPNRVFAKELEFKVEYPSMKWVLVNNWGYGYGSTYQYAGDNLVWYFLKDVVTTSTGTFAIVRLQNNRDHDVVKLTDNGLVKVSTYEHPISLTEKGNVIHKLDEGGKSNFYIDGVLKESVSQINGSGYIGYTIDGTFVVYDPSKSTGNHLYFIKSGVVRATMPTKTITESQARAVPFEYGNFFPIDPNVEYAGGNSIYIVGNKVFINYVGEFFGGSGGQTNLWWCYENNTFLKRVGMTSWESESLDGNQAPRVASGNSYGGGVSLFNGVFFIHTNCEHTGAIQTFNFIIN